MSYGKVFVCLLSMVNVTSGIACATCHDVNNHSVACTSLLFEGTD